HQGWRDLPRELRDVSQRGGRRGCPHPRQVRPGSRRRLRQARLRGHGHRPAEHAGLQRDQPVPRGQARRHHVPRGAREDRLARWHLARLAGSGDRGPVRVDHHPVPAPGYRCVAGGEGEVNASMSNNHDGSTAARGVTTVAPKEGGGFPNPGLPPHVHRQADLHKSAEKRAERVVAGMFLLSVIGTIVFIAAYFLVTPTGRNIFAEEGTPSALWWSNLITGLGLAVAVFFIGA